MAEADRSAAKRKGRSTKGRQKVPPVSAEKRREALQELMVQPLIGPATQAVLLDIGLQASLREAAAGRFGAFRVGRCFKIPSSGLREALGLSSSTPDPAEQVAA